MNWHAHRDSRLLWYSVPLAAVAFATAGVILTYSVFSQTFDEPLHIAGGLEWIQNGSMTLSTENPPLARVAVATGPFIAGARLPELAMWDPRIQRPDRPSGFELGNGVLYRDERYSRNLSQARAGAIPFLWLLAGVVWLWSGGRTAARSSTVAVIGVLALPPILAHSGLATTDVPFVAMFLAALYGLRRLIERRSILSVFVFAALLALAILTKFSTLLFFGPACLGIGLA